MSTFTSVTEWSAYSAGASIIIGFGISLMCFHSISTVVLCCWSKIRIAMKILAKISGSKSLIRLIKSFFLPSYYIPSLNSLFTLHERRSSGHYSSHCWSEGNGLNHLPPHKLWSCSHSMASFLMDVLPFTRSSERCLSLENDLQCFLSLFFESSAKCSFLFLPGLGFHFLFQYFHLPFLFIPFSSCQSEYTHTPQKLQWYSPRSSDLTFSLSLGTSYWWYQWLCFLLKFRSPSFCLVSSFLSNFGQYTSWFFLQVIVFVCLWR